MKHYLLLIGFPLYLRWFYRAVKFFWPVIKYAAAAWFSRHTKTVSKTELNKPLSQRGITMSTEVCGIDNIKRIFNIGIVLGMAAEANVPAWKDGKTDAQDFSFALKLPSVVADLINMQFTQVVPEIKDVSATEAQELFAFFNEHYKSPNAKVEEIVEKGLATVATVIGFIQGLIAIIKA